ncbi:hypothetical protein SEA_CAMERICO_8 [Gordonia phage Camerico]|nr:hypothetical protein SEA_CAMERICO_8 [Gordonia phage Camerico]
MLLPNAFDTDLHDALSRLLIARPDVLAEQSRSGAYRPVHAENCRCETCVRGGTDAPIYAPWDRPRLQDHLAGKRTYGHYVLRENVAKFFCFDIDLKTKANITAFPSFDNAPENLNASQFDQWLGENSRTFETQPREIWYQSGGTDAWIEWQLRTVAELFKFQIEATLGIKTLCSFSGSKGVHVYGFPQPGQAVDAQYLRDCGLYVINNMGHYWRPKNKNNVVFIGQNDPTIGMFEVELFPKQSSVPEGGGFGNLVRMELGINRKNGSRGFILDTSSNTPVAKLVPEINPLRVLGDILS